MPPSNPIPQIDEGDLGRDEADVRRWNPTAVDILQEPD
jgi:hypothetical protein